MAPNPRLTDADILLLTTPDDTEDAPWMVMPDLQWRILELLMPTLRRYVREHKLPWYLAADLKVTGSRRHSRRPLDLAPDLLMAEADDRIRASWNIAREGKPPQFVLEVVTKESWRRDTQDKPLLYEAWGIAEYALFAPERRRPGPALWGFRLGDNGVYLPWAADADGVLRSQQMQGLGLVVEDARWLRVVDTEGNRLPTPDEEAEAEAAARRNAELRAGDAEAELVRLRDLLDRIQRGEG